MIQRDELALKQRSLAPYTDRAIAFTECVMKEIEDRRSRDLG
jgi:hypothetical protein